MPATVTAVAGGTVVTPAGLRRADVTVDGGRIAAVSEPSRDRPRDGTTVDAAGCLVLPGGVDPHTHVMAGIREATLAAARGGTTTVLSFTNPDPGEDEVACMVRRRGEIAAGAAAVDTGLHAAIGSPDAITAGGLAAIRAAGAAAVKVYLAYPEFGIMCTSRALLRILRTARRLGMVTCVHCENGPVIEELLAAALAGGPLSPQVFASTRPPEVEEEAVARAIAAASLADAPCYLVHLSTAQALDQVRLARRRGGPAVVAEACLHHLVLTDSVYAGPDAGRYLVAPPLRAASHAEALWEGLADGTIDAVGSDHCQVRSATQGALAEAGGHYEFGLRGIGERLPVLLSEGLARGLPLTRLVQVACENPARAFGHYPRKGALLPGADADIAVWDPDGQTLLTGTGTADSPYAGRRLRGSIRAVIARGSPIIVNGTPAGQGSGRYLAAAGTEPPGPGPAKPS